MVLGLKKLFKGSARSPAALPDDLRAALEAWRGSAAPELGELHFLTRYVVVDIATAGTSAAEHDLLGICALGVRGGAVLPDDAFACDTAADEGGDAAVDRRLAAFLEYAAKAPLVTFHTPFVAGFMQRAYKERLGVDFQPRWIDLAWLLPSLFPDKSRTVAPLDDWLDMFGIAGGGRRDTMANALVLARLFQMLLVRANGKDIATAQKLVEESQAATLLRRTS